MEERRVESKSLDFSFPETKSKEVICEMRVGTVTGDEHATDAGLEDSSNPAEKLTDGKVEERSCDGSCLSREDHKERTTEEHQLPANSPSVVTVEGAVAVMHNDSASPAEDSYPACQTETQTSDCNDEDCHRSAAAHREPDVEFLPISTNDDNQREKVVPPSDRAQSQQLFLGQPPEQADASVQDQIQPTPRAIQQSKEEKMLYHSVLHEMQQQQKHRPGRKFRKKTLMKMAKLFVAAKEWESKMADAPDGTSVEGGESSAAQQNNTSVAPKESNDDCSSQTVAPPFSLSADFSLEKAASMILQRMRRTSSPIKKRAVKFPGATEISDTPISSVEVPQDVPQPVTEPIGFGGNELPTNIQEATSSVCLQTSKARKKPTKVKVKNGTLPNPSSAGVQPPVGEGFMASDVAHVDVGVHSEDPSGIKNTGAVLKVKKKTGQTSRKRTKIQVLPVAHQGEIINDGQQCDITAGEAVLTQQPPLFEASGKGKKRKKATPSLANAATSGKQCRRSKSKPLNVPAVGSVEAVATTPQSISQSTESTPVTSLVSTDVMLVQTESQQGVSQDVALKTIPEKNKRKQEITTSKPNRGQRVVQPRATGGGFVHTQTEIGFSTEAPDGLTPVITSSQFQDSHSQADNVPSTPQPEPSASFFTSTADQRAPAGLLAQTPEPTCESVTLPVKKKSRPRKSPAKKPKNPKTLNDPVKEINVFSLQHDTKLGAETTQMIDAETAPKGKGKRASTKGKTTKAKKVQIGTQDSTTENLALKTEPQKKPRKKRISAPKPKCKSGSQVQKLLEDGGSLLKQIKAGFSAEASDGLTPAITNSQFQESYSQGDDIPSTQQPEPSASFCMSTVDQHAPAGLLTQTPEPTCKLVTLPAKKKSQPRKSPTKKPKNPKTLNDPVKEINVLNLQHDSKLGTETTPMIDAETAPKGKGKRANTKGKTAKAKKVQSGNQDSTAENLALKTEPQKKPRKKKISAPKPKCNSGQQVQTLLGDASLQAQMQTDLNDSLTPTITSSQPPDSQKQADNIQLSHQPEPRDPPRHDIAGLLTKAPNIKPEPTFKSETPPAKKKRISKTSQPWKSPAKSPVILNSLVQENCDCVMCSIIIPETKLGEESDLAGDAGTLGKGKGTKVSRKRGMSKAKTKKTLNLDLNIKSEVSAANQVDFSASGLKMESCDSYASVIKTPKTYPPKKRKTAKKQADIANSPTVLPPDGEPFNAGTTGEPVSSNVEHSLENTGGVVPETVCKPAEKTKRRKKPKLEPGTEKIKPRKAAAAKQVFTSHVKVQGESAQPDKGLVSRSQVTVPTKRRRTKKAIVSEAGEQSSIPGNVIKVQNILGNVQDATVIGNQERMSNVVTDEQRISDSSKGVVSAGNPEEMTKAKRKKNISAVRKREKVSGIAEEVGKVTAEVQSGFATTPTIEKQKKKRGRKRASPNLETLGSEEGVDEAQISNLASSNQNLHAVKAKVRKRYKKVKLEFSSVQNNVSNVAIVNPAGDTAACVESPVMVTGSVALTDPDKADTSYLKETRTEESTPVIEKDMLASAADGEAEKVTTVRRRKVVKSYRNIRQTTKKKALMPKHAKAEQQKVKNDVDDLISHKVFEKIMEVRKKGIRKASKSLTVEDAVVKATTFDATFSRMDSDKDIDQSLPSETIHKTASPHRNAISIQQQDQTAGESSASLLTYTLSSDFFDFIAGDKKSLNIKERIKAVSKLRHEKAKLQRQFLCSFCSRVFRHISAITVHKRIHTGEKPYRCLRCTKRFAQLSQLNTHLKIHREPQTVCCPCCDGKFEHKDELIAHFQIHMKESHSSATAKGAKSLQEGDSMGKKPFSCPTCSKEFSHRATFRMHRRIHGAGKLHRCTVCKKKFCKSSSLITHEKTHWPVKPYVCSVCSESFNHKPELQSHFETHSETTDFSCSKCDKAFRSFASLRAHQVSSACSGNKGSIDTDSFLVTRGINGQIAQPVYFKCPACKQLFRHWCQYHLHLQTHTTAPLHCCDTCGQHYKQASEIRSHCDTCCRCSGEETACRLCNSEILEESETGQREAPQLEGQQVVSSVVERDREAAVSVQSPSPCPSGNDGGSLSTNPGPGLCLETTGGSGQMVRSRSQLLIFRHGGRYPYFKRWNTLRLRQRTHRQIGRPFSCTECDLEFHFLGSYTDHLWDHASLRPYACPLCPNTFESEENLSSHIRESHNQPECMKCRTCGKAFSNVRNFKQHKMLHKGAKSHFCLPCGVSFSSNLALKTHLKTHRLRLKVPQPAGFVEPFLFPYPCTKCTAKFTSADLLHAHQVCHFEGGKKPEQPPDSIVSCIPNRAADTPKMVSQSSEQKCSIPLCNDKHLFRYPHPDSLYVVPAASPKPLTTVKIIEEEPEEILNQSLPVTTSINNVRADCHETSAANCHETSPANCSTSPQSVCTAMTNVGLKKSNAINQLKELLLHRSKKSPIMQDLDPVYSTKPLTELTKPSAEFPKPLVVMQPSVALTKPSAALMKPLVALSKPSAELTKPSAELTKPSAELMKPSVDFTKSLAELTKPSAELTKPSGELTKRLVVSTQPAVALTKPSAALMTPLVMSKPSAELPKPSAELTKPPGELTKCLVVSPQPSVALTKPLAALMTPLILSSKPSAESMNPSPGLGKPSAALTKPSTVSPKPSEALAKPSAAPTIPSAALRKPSAALRKPSAALSNPSAALTKPSAALGKPSAASTKPSLQLRNPAATLPKPSAVSANPSAALTKPPAALAKPSTTLAKPSAVLTKPSSRLINPLAALVKPTDDAHSCIICQQKFKDISKLYQHYIIHARGT
ncbi:uncharacterized protein si:ch73-347e22.4 [Thalassophryne amazonica]|uniref:uncharacterized protein si:ch73-347e22.4 n=1 Tax=Thalassophryne amazonica TaxID=390379 RepID=UPI001471A78F|nr:uncharacterized protein si:ch73-347e22.4 [Thalassophryne amazonica]